MPMCWRMKRNAAAALVLLVVVMLLAACPAGCGSSKKAKVNPGRTEIVHERITEEPNEAGVIKRRTIEKATASSVGASMEAATDDGKVAAEFNGSAPTISLAGIGTATGGAASSEIKVSGRARAGLIVLAGLLALGAVGCLWLRQITLALALGGSALLCVAAYVYPWTLLLVPLVLLLALLWAGWTKLRAHEGLRAVVGGVASAPVSAAAIVKAEIAKQADERDRREIEKVKEMDRL